MGIFKRGYKGVREEKARQEEEKAKRKNRLFNFFLTKDGEEANLRFLTEEPVNFYSHSHKVIRNGKEHYDSTTCSGSDCQDCENGDRPTFKGGYLVVDRREFEYKDKDGKKQKGKDQVRFFEQGTKVLSQLDRISTRYGLTNRDITMIRLGTGTGTTYTFERGDEQKLSKKEIEQLLPENLREKFDGTMESLYSIVEDQIMAGVPGATESSPTRDDDEEDENDTKTSRSKLVSVEDEEPEEEVKPKLLKKTSLFNKKR